MRLTHDVKCISWSLLLLRLSTLALSLFTEVAGSGLLKSPLDCIKHQFHILRSPGFPELSLVLTPQVT